MSIESVRNVNNYQQSGTSNASQAPKVSTQANQAVATKVQDISLSNEKSNTPSVSNDARTEMTNEQIKKAVSELNKKMSSTSCQFGIHDATNRVTIKIIDNITKDVIKEYPAEETLEMIEKAWELAGIMVDEKL